MDGIRAGFLVRERAHHFSRYDAAAFVRGDLKHQYVTRFAYADYDPPHVLYATEVSRDKLDTVLDFFEGHATIIPEFDEDNPGAEYPPFKKYVDETRRNRLYGISTW